MNHLKIYKQFLFNIFGLINNVTEHHLVSEHEIGRIKSTTRI